MTSILDDLGIATDVAQSTKRIVTARAVNVSIDMATFEIVRPDGSITEALCPATEWYPDRQWQVGESYQMVEIEGGSRPMLSVVRNELLVALLAGVSPEVRTGAVRVMGAVRLPGVRAKVAVATTVPELDAIASCVGRKANRVRAVQAMLMKERVDFVAWNEDPAQFLMNAMAPAQITRVEISGRDAVAYAPKHLMAAAVGRGGLNSSLAGRLVGLKVRVEPDA